MDRLHPCLVHCLSAAIRFKKMGGSKPCVAMDDVSLRAVVRMSTAELLQHALQVGVPTRTRAADGQMLRRTVKEVLADCLLKQASASSSMSAHMPSDDDCISDSRSMNQHVKRHCANPSVESRKRDRAGQKTLLEFMSDAEQARVLAYRSTFPVKSDNISEAVRFKRSIGTTESALDRNIPEGTGVFQRIDAFDIGAARQAKLLRTCNVSRKADLSPGSLCEPPSIRAVDNTSPEDKLKRMLQRWQLLEDRRLCLEQARLVQTAKELFRSDNVAEHGSSV